MIGVKPEGADGAAVHVIGGAVDTQWLRAFAQAHEKAGFDRVLVGYTSTSAEGFAVDPEAELVIDPATGPVTGDANRLQQVIWNLLANAIKFARSGDRVTVAVAYDADGPLCRDG